jgi:hypothetical protein
LIAGGVAVITIIVVIAAVVVGAVRVGSVRAAIVDEGVGERFPCVSVVGGSVGVHPSRGAIR